MSDTERARSLAAMGEALQQSMQEYLIDLYFSPVLFPERNWPKPKPLTKWQTFKRNLRYRVSAAQIWWAGLFRYLTTGECGECEMYD